MNYLYFEYAVSKSFYRVSRLAQERLKNGKTVELQDLNSPQHIADMYTETYNREWSSAYEEVNQSFRDGGETIRHLLQILEVIFQLMINNSST